MPAPELTGAVRACSPYPIRPVAVLAGDGGFMFTMPELVTAAETRLALPVIIWENGGLEQIQDDMDVRDITRVGVEGINPDFVALAKACHCQASPRATGWSSEPSCATPSRRTGPP